MRRPVGEPRPAGSRRPGPVLFARYAFGPNRLGYCGSDAVDELFGEVTAGHDDRALRELARSFEGAWPYLELIARANGLPDPLDRRVVEAYWLGNALLDRVGPRRLGESLATRFRPRLRPEGWRWLAGKPEAGGVPVHAFHVLDVFPRVGLLRTGSIDGALAVMDSCRIRWGRVLERDGDQLVVNAVPLVMTRRHDLPSGPRASSASRPGATVSASSTGPSRATSSRSTGRGHATGCRRDRLADLVGWTDARDRCRQPDPLSARARAAGPSIGRSGGGDRQVVTDGTDRADAGYDDRSGGRRAIAADSVVEDGTMADYDADIHIGVGLHRA